MLPLINTPVFVLRFAVYTFVIIPTFYKPKVLRHERKKLDKGLDDIQIFVFCTVNRLCLQSVNTNICIWSPPLIGLFSLCITGC